MLCAAAKSISGETDLPMCGSWLLLPNWHLSSSAPTYIKEGHHHPQRVTVKVKVKVKSLSRVQLFATPWTVAHQAHRIPWFDSWVKKICWRRDRLPTLVFLGLLVAQLVKNLPAMQETCQSLGWEDPLEKGKGYSLQYSGLENSMDCVVHGIDRKSVV